MKPEIYKGSKWFLRNSKIIGINNLSKVIDFAWNKIPEYSSKVKAFVEKHPVENGAGYQISIYDHSIDSFDITIQTEDSKKGHFQTKVGSFYSALDQEIKFPNFAYYEIQRLQLLWLALIWKTSNIEIENKFAYSRSYSDLIFIDFKTYLTWFGEIDPNIKQVLGLSTLELLVRTNETPSSVTSFLFRNEDAFIEIFHNSAHVMKRQFKGFEETVRWRKRCLSVHLATLVSDLIAEALKNEFIWIDYPSDFPPTPEIIFTSDELRSGKYL